MVKQLKELKFILVRHFRVSRAEILSMVQYKQNVRSNFFPGQKLVRYRVNSMYSTFRNTPPEHLQENQEPLKNYLEIIPNIKNMAEYICSLHSVIPVMRITCILACLVISVC